MTNDSTSCPVLCVDLIVIAAGAGAHSGTFDRFLGHRVSDSRQGTPDFVLVGRWVIFVQVTNWRTLLEVIRWSLTNGHLCHNN